MDILESLPMIAGVDENGRMFWYDRGSALRNWRLTRAGESIALIETIKNVEELTTCAGNVLT